MSRSSYQLFCTKCQQQIPCTAENKNPKCRNRSRLIDADGDCAWGNVLDYLDIHQFALRIGFSLSEGDDMRTIRATIENSTRNSNKVESVQIPYPTGLLDISNIQLATGFFINPMFIWLNISYIALGI